MGFDVLSCPSKLPHEIQPGQKMARWFGPPYNAWFVGTVDHVNKRRTKSENVCVAFESETEGKTTGMFVAEAETYGADKLWCLLKPIPIELDSEDELISNMISSTPPAAKKARREEGSPSTQPMQTE